MKIKNAIAALESWAPGIYQESYDNAKLIVGDPNAALTGILTTLDCTEPIVEEAIERGCNLIVAHHPIVFGGLKSFTGKNYVERTVMMAIKNDIAIYAIHTNLDNMKHGVNDRFAALLGLQNTSILAPKRGLLKKLTTFVPLEQKDVLLEALSKAGAGNIGNYAECSFQLEGVGTFKPNDQANPHIGEQGQLERVKEARLEVILPVDKEGAVLYALKKNHPYEEVAYYLHALENVHQDIGSGVVGELPEAMDEVVFLGYLKERMNLKVIKHTPLRDKPVQKIALCGGAGSFLLRNAIGAQADFYITSDFKYHEFFDAEGRIVIADIGHFESETATRHLLAEYLKSAMPEADVVVSEVNTNPVEYFV